MTDKRRVVGNEVMGPIRKNYQTARNIVDPSTVWPQRITKIHPKAAKFIPYFNYLAFDLFVVVSLGVVASATDLINWAFLAYGLLVLILRTDSQRLFSAALISLVIIPGATIANRTDTVDDFAVMTFYFLLIGLIRAVIELRKEPRRQ